MTVSKRSLGLVGVLVVEAILAVPITIALGSLSLYFMAIATNASVTAFLGLSGIENTTMERPLFVLLVLAPASLAIGVVGLAVLGGYFWLVAKTARAVIQTRAHR